MLEFQIVSGLVWNKHLNPRSGNLTSQYGNTPATQTLTRLRYPAANETYHSSLVKYLPQLITAANTAAANSKKCDSLTLQQPFSLVALFFLKRTTLNNVKSYHPQRIWPRSQEEDASS